MTICLSVTAFTPGTSWALLNLGDFAYTYLLHPECEALVHISNTTVTIQLPGGDSVKLFVVNSTQGDIFSCTVSDWIQTSSERDRIYRVTAVYDIDQKKIILPNGAGIEYLPGGGRFEIFSYYSALPLYEGLPMFGSGFGFLNTSSIHCGASMGTSVVMAFDIHLSSAGGDTVTNYYEASDFCALDGCPNGNLGNQWFFDFAVCCMNGCPANQYGTGCNCTPCPTMVNKAGQTVSGTSTMGDNATVEQCSMGTSHVFSDASGDWSFQPACPAS